ncbi:MAG: hypothetical protein NC485_10285 [Ruminococcus flavefaciens]|nr:hypothetical protein [Ruminococcus flavefaciens]MCM1059285.1 hypothetical protein [Eubacterium sp.]
MERIISITWLAFLIYVLYKFCCKFNSTSDNGRLEFECISEQIERLNNLREQLQTVEKMITDISVCSPDEHEKVISCEWLNSFGEKQRYDLWIDGKNNNSNELLKIAYSERKRLRSSLLSEIKNLSERCYENNYGNDTKIEEINERGAFESE